MSSSGNEDIFILLKMNPGYKLMKSVNHFVYHQYISVYQSSVLANTEDFGLLERQTTAQLRQRQHSTKLMAILGQKHYLPYYNSHNRERQREGVGNSNTGFYSVLPADKEKIAAIIIIIVNISYNYQFKNRCVFQGKGGRRLKNKIK